MDLHTVGRVSLLGGLRYFEVTWAAGRAAILMATWVLCLLYGLYNSTFLHRPDDQVVRECFAVAAVFSFAAPVILFLLWRSPAPSVQVDTATILDIPPVEVLAREVSDLPPVPGISGFPEVVVATFGDCVIVDASLKIRLAD